MMKKTLFILFMTLSALLVGCATSQLDAPCNNQATFCGTKTKINKW